LRGYRIELGEIEAVLNKHRDVQEAVALVREYEPGDRRLVAYVVPREPLALTSADLRDFVMQKLPEHMTPSRFHFMAKMPLSKNGKIDQRLLSTVEDDPESPGADDGPRSGAERLLAKIWSEALRIKHIGLDQNFFDLGGHSMLMPVIVLAVKERFGRDLSIVDFLAYPTVRSLAQRIEQTDERTTNISESTSRSARQKEYLKRRRETSRTE
jgi:acyl carrier protein